MSSILTIGIPTFNRCKSLKIMLPGLLESIFPVKDKVDVIISDNASTDETEEYLIQFLTTVSKDYSIKLYRNEVNIGVSKNITRLFERATGEYFMFLGDDDLIYPQALERIIEILESQSPPSAIIQTAWPWISDQEPKSGFFSWEESFGFFYEYGNAWAGIIKRSSALHAIRSRGIADETEATVWPQTIMAYLAMYDLRESAQVYLANFKIGDRIDSGGLNLVNFEYLVRSLSGQLTAVKLVCEGTDNRKLSKTFLSFKGYGLMSHFKGMLVMAILMRYKIDRSVARLLRDPVFGIRGIFFSLIFSLFHYPRFFRFLVKSAYCVVKFSTPAKYNQKMETLRKNYAIKEAGFKNQGMRYDNWF